MQATIKDLRTALEVIVYVNSGSDAIQVIFQIYPELIQKSFSASIIPNVLFHTYLTEALFHALCERFRSPDLTITDRNGVIRQINRKQSRYKGVSSIFFKIFAGCRPHHINSLPQSREKAVVTCNSTSSLQPFHSILYFQFDIT